ncbi:hypothetical protein BVRB_038590, partial [Beta vulgaris subsp. vulgaris]
MRPIILLFLLSKALIAALTDTTAEGKAVNSLSDTSCIPSQATQFFSFFSWLAYLACNVADNQDICSLKMNIYDFFPMASE